MKTFKNIFALLLIILSFNSCMDDYTEVFTANSPIYLSFEDLRSAVKTTAATDLENPERFILKMVTSL